MLRAFRRPLALVMALVLILSSLSGVVMAAEEGEAPFDSFQDISLGQTLTADITAAGGYAYFRFVPGMTHSYAFTSDASGDTYGYLYDADGNELTCDDDSGSGNNFLVTYTLTAGETYYFGARWYSSSMTGSFPVSVNLDENGHAYDENGICACGATLPYGQWLPCGESVEYCLSTDGTLTIRGDGAMNPYNIYSGNPAPWYAFEAWITSVVIEEDVTNIGEFAFYGCANLSTVEIPNSVTSIGVAAFWYCTSLESIVLPEGLTRIEGWTFANCANIKSVILPDGLTYIGDSAFSCCYKLESISIPDSVIHIDSNAFLDCLAMQIDDQGLAMVDCWVLGYNTLSSSLTIPEGVRGIGDGAFQFSGLESVSLPEGLIGIGEDAFFNCTSLRTVSIPDSVTYVGSNAFYNCPVVQTDDHGLMTVDGWVVGYNGEESAVTVPAGIVGIGGRAFAYSSLESITLPEGLRIIGDNAFEGCYSMKTVELPDSVTSIGSYAFAWCYGINSIYFEGNAPSIAADAWNGVTAIAYYPPENDTWTADTLQDYGGTLNWRYIGQAPFDFQDISLGQTLAVDIPAGAYAYFRFTPEMTHYYSLTMNVDGEVVVYDANGYYLGNIAGVTLTAGQTYYFRVLPYYVYSWQPTQIGLSLNENGHTYNEDGLCACGATIPFGQWLPCGEGVEYCLSNDGTLTIRGDGAMDNYDDWSNFAPWHSFEAWITSVVVEEGVTNIGTFAFSNCTSLRTVEIPDSVTYIGNNAFYYCTALERVVLPDGLTSIETSTFYNCTSLESVTLPEGLTNIGESAFGWCTSLSQINIPDSVTHIGSYAFSGCPAVQRDAQGLATIGNWAIGRDSDISVITIPAGIKGICDNAFSYSGLQIVTLPEGLIYIGANAFYCSNLRTINIPESVTYVGSDAFAGCSVTQTDDQGLLTVDGWVVGYNGTASEVTVPAGIVGIGGAAFFYSSLESITLPEGLRFIGDCAFEQCYGLETIELPDSVTSIGSYAFAWCYGLYSICFAGDAPGIASDAWYGVTATVYYPPENDTWTADVMQDYGGTLNWRYIGQSPFECQDITLGQTLTADITVAEHYAYFRFVPEMTHSYAFTSDASGDTYGYLYDAAGNELTRDDDSGSGNNFRVAYTLTAGETYYFGARWYSLETGSFPVSVNLDENGHAYDENGVCACGAVIPYGQWLPCGDSVEYCISNDGTLTIRGTGPMDYYNYYSDPAPWYAFEAWVNAVVVEEGVTNISDCAFYGCTALERVSLPRELTYIGWSAFSGCESLSSIEIPDSVIYISGNAFSNCTSLERVVLPDGLTSIETNTFYNCTSLESIALPEGLTSISGWAFANCTSLRTVEIPDSVTYIGNNAFGSCPAVQIDAQGLMTLDGWVIGYNGTASTITIPAGIKGIGASVFSNRRLQSVTLPEGLICISQEAFFDCTSLSTIHIPASVTYIGSNAFYNCPAVQTDDQGLMTLDGWVVGYNGTANTITIPADIVGIGDYVFMDCYDLSTIYFEGDAPIIGTYAWNGVTATAYYPPENDTWTADVLQNYGGNLNWRYIGQAPFDFQDISLGQTLALDISAYEYTYFRFTPEVTHSYVLSMSADGNIYVYDASGAELGTPGKVTLTAGQTYYFGVWPYYVSTGEPTRISLSLNENGHVYDENGVCVCGATIPYGQWLPCGEDVEYCLSTDGTLTIRGTGPMYYYDYYSNPAPWYSFEAWVNAVVVEEGVTNISECAFYDCTALERVTLPQGLISIGWDAFYGCTSLSQINIPASVTNIGGEAFYGCPVVETDAQGLMIVDTWVVGNNGTASTVTIPAGIKGINYMQNGSLESVILPEGLTCIGDAAFAGCAGLTEINIPASVISIGYAAFAGCSSLKSIALPEGLTYIEPDTFFDCTSLESVTLPDGLISIFDCAFYNCTSLTDVNIPASVSYIGYKAFYGCPIAQSEAEGLVILDGWVIGYNGNAAAVTVPAGVKGIVGSAFEGNTSLESVVLPEGLTSIGAYAFEDCTNLSRINIPASVTYIDSGAFAGCSSLESITLPYGLSGIRGMTFFGCTSLSQINIPASVAVIEEGAFAGCTSLKSVIIPASVEYLSTYLFAESGVETIIFEGSAPDFSNLTFFGITATAYYPAGNPTWTEDVRQNYEGTITWIPLFEVIEGADSVLNTSSPEELTIRVNNDYTKFVGVTVDGVEVDPSNYTVSEGSTIVTLNAEYLSTLDAREHDITVLFTNGAAATTFTILNSVPGDINGDGKINGKDGILLAQYLAEWNVTINLDAADVNGDGKVNGKDGILLAQYLAEWDVTLG